MGEKLTSNMEDYLETIHLLMREKGHVRVKDISLKMGYTMPSVSGAVKNLEKRGYVQHDRYDLIELTSAGQREAKRVYRRHNVIKTFLMDVLSLDADVAEQDACSIEHVISPQAVESLARLLRKEQT